MSSKSNIPINLGVTKMMSIKDLVGKKNLKTVLGMANPEFAELSTEEFNQFPLEDLSELANQVMAFSGVTGNVSQASKT
jgi:hypothetical protein